MRRVLVLVLSCLAVTAAGCGTPALQTSASPVPTQAMCPPGTTLKPTVTPTIYVCE